MTLQTQFSNVDLEIDSERDLSEFTEQFNKHGFALHVGECEENPGTWQGRYELNENDLNLEQTLSGLCDAIEGLKGHALEQWKTANRRDFSIGIQAGSEPRWVEWSVAPQLLQRVAEAGARLLICVYAPYDDAEHPEEIE